MQKVLFVATALLLSGCNATQAPPYQKDRAPEDRTQYNGAEGLVQHQKDQSYLMEKELSDKCEKAQVDLAIAKTESDEDEVERQRRIMADTCV